MPDKVKYVAESVQLGFPQAKALLWFYLPQFGKSMLGLSLLRGLDAGSILAICVCTHLRKSTPSPPSKYSVFVLKQDYIKNDNKVVSVTTIYTLR
jgi:hypothetical protein